MPKKTGRRLSADSSVGDKADYVRSQGQDREHHCHWPGCKEQVPPAMWGCRKHWYMLPQMIRERIWAYYRPGQERDMRPSREYLATAQEAEEWIFHTYGERAYHV